MILIGFYLGYARGILELEDGFESGLGNSGVIWFLEIGWRKCIQTAILSFRLQSFLY